jgi:hypothetical protein
MKAGDTIKIRNSSGILTVELVKKLNNRNVTRGLHGGVGPFGCLRFEIHERHGELIYSFYDSEKNGEEIILVFNITSYDKDNMEVWKCKIPECGEQEDDTYTSWKYDEIECECE